LGVNRLVLLVKALQWTGQGPPQRIRSHALTDPQSTLSRGLIGHQPTLSHVMTGPRPTQMGPVLMTNPGPQLTLSPPAKLHKSYDI
jgi:hypothetical protein